MKGSPLTSECCPWPRPLTEHGGTFAQSRSSSQGRVKPHPEVTEIQHRRPKLEVVQTSWVMEKEKTSRSLVGCGGTLRIPRRVL